MRNLYFFTEEPSIKPVIEAVCRALPLPKDTNCHVFPHQGKQDLKKALEKTLPSISKMPGSLIVVLQDQDGKDCKAVKQELLDQIGDNAHNCPIKVRVVCDELESWYLGDMQALQQVYPRFKARRFEGKKGYREVDQIRKPSQRLAEIVPELKGRSKPPKTRLADEIAECLVLDRNRSTSFRQFVGAIRELSEIVDRTA